MRYYKQKTTCKIVASKHNRVVCVLYPKVHEDWKHMDVGGMGAQVSWEVNKQPLLKVGYACQRIINRLKSLSFIPKSQWLNSPIKKNPSIENPTPKALFLLFSIIIHILSSIISFLHFCHHCHRYYLHLPLHLRLVKLWSSSHHLHFNLLRYHHLRSNLLRHHHLITIIVVIVSSLLSPSQSSYSSSDLTYDFVNFIFIVINIVYCTKFNIKSWCRLRHRLR